MDQYEQPLRSVSLESHGSRPIIVMPNPDPDKDGMISHDLPPLPVSTFNWLGAFGTRVWREHYKCCAMLLITDTDTMAWGLTVPSQMPRKDGVSWRLSDVVPDGVIDPEKLLVAGSFQTSRCRTPDQAIGIVPAVDGLHIIHPTNVPLGGAWCFLRAEGELVTQYLDDLIADDWGSRIEQAMSYIPL